MLYGFLLTVYVIACILLALLVMIQKSKSSLGLGSLGSSTQMLFGGSGGQDLFQKITWVLGFIFMAGALMLGYMKSREISESKYLSNIKPVVQQEMPVMPETEPVLPAATNAEKLN